MSLRSLLVALGALVLVAFALLVWPRLHAYWTLDYDSGECLVQMNRLTGHTKAFCTPMLRAGWEHWTEEKTEQTASEENRERKMGNVVPSADSVKEGGSNSLPLTLPSTSADLPKINDLPLPGDRPKDEYYSNPEVQNTLAALIEAAGQNPSEYSGRTCRILQKMVKDARQALADKSGIPETLALTCAEKREGG